MAIIIPKTLIALVRSAVSNVPCCIGVLSPDEWMEVLALAERQGVMAIAFDGVQLLPKEQQPDIDNLMEWLGQTSYMESVYESHRKVLADISACSNAQGIRILLLKGIGLSRYYPVPNHRPCGDIDIYAYGKMQEVNRILVPMGGSVENEEQLDSAHLKHAIICFRDVVIENHARYLDGYVTKAEGKAEEYINAINEDILTEDGYYVCNPNKNYIFLLSHMSRHFSEYDCITLRHLLDWGLFLKAERENFDWNEIRKQLYAIKLVKANDLFTSLAQDLVGCDIGCFIINGVSENDEECVLNEILRKKDHRQPKNKIARIINKIRLLIGNYWKFQYLAITFTERLKWSIWLHADGTSEV